MKNFAYFLQDTEFWSLRTELDPNVLEMLDSHLCPFLIFTDPWPCRKARSTPYRRTNVNSFLTCCTCHLFSVVHCAGMPTSRSSPPGSEHTISWKERTASQQTPIFKKFWHKHILFPQCCGSRSGIQFEIYDHKKKKTNNFLFWIRDPRSGLRDVYPGSTTLFLSFIHLVLFHTPVRHNYSISELNVFFEISQKMLAKVPSFRQDENRLPQIKVIRSSGPAGTGQDPDSISLWFRVSGS